MMDQAESEAVDLVVAERQCRGFEPQTWRRTLCKNCFLTAETHDQNKKRAPKDEGPPKAIFAKPSDSDEEQEVKIAEEEEEEEDADENPKSKY